jgi:hypothetical protein
MDQLSMHWVRTDPLITWLPDHTCLWGCSRADRIGRGNTIPAHSSYILQESWPFLSFMDRFPLQEIWPDRDQAATGPCPFVVLLHFGHPHYWVPLGHPFMDGSLISPISFLSLSRRSGAFRLEDRLLNSDLIYVHKNFSSGRRLTTAEDLSQIKAKTPSWSIFVFLFL